MGFSRGKTHDTCKTSGNDCETAEMSGFKRGVFSGASFAVVPVTNNNPLYASLLVITCSCGDGTDFTGESVLNLVGFAVGGVDGADQHVVRDVVEMAAVLEPGTSHYGFVSDVYSGTEKIPYWKCDR